MDQHIRLAEEIVHACWCEMQLRRAVVAGLASFIDHRRYSGELFSIEWLKTVQRR